MPKSLCLYYIFTVDDVKTLMSGVSPESHSTNAPTGCMFKGTCLGSFSSVPTILDISLRKSLTATICFPTVLEITVPSNLSSQCDGYSCPPLVEISVFVGHGSRHVSSIRVGRFHDTMRRGASSSRIGRFHASSEACGL